MPRDPFESRISDRIRYEHMLAAARAVTTFIEGRQRPDLEKNDMLRRAILHAIQEIGEAAARMTDDGRSLAPTCPGAASCRCGTSWCTCTGASILTASGQSRRGT